MSNTIFSCCLESKKKYAARLGENKSFDPHVTAGILSGFTITVIIHGESLPGVSRENAFIVVQGFRAGGQEDYSIFRARRKMSSLASSQID